MKPEQLIVIGASAGGIEALRQVLPALPADLPAAVVVVVHIPPDGPSRLPEVLARLTSLPAAPAGDGEPLEAGRIYVAPNDHHLLVEDGRLRTVRGPREHNHRPAIDPLFRTAARSFGSNAVAVVLSGAGDDGAAGLAAVKAAGGTAVVQEPSDSLFREMPARAMGRAHVDHSLPADEIGPLLARFCANGPRGGRRMVSPTENGINRRDRRSRRN